MKNNEIKFLMKMCLNASDVSRVDKKIYEVETTTQNILKKIVTILDFKTKMFIMIFVT